MADTADLSGDVTRVDVAGLDRWFKRVGHVAAGLDRQLRHLSVEAPDMVGGDWRIHEAGLLRDRHEAVLTEARSAVGRISVALRDLQASGRRVTGTHTTVDDDNAGGVDGAARR